MWGTDVAGDAVKLARRNAKELGLRARFEVGDLFGGLPKRLRGSADVITLHPPYVPAGEIDDLPDEIRDWEPPHTLTDHSTDGLGLIGRTVAESPTMAAGQRLAADGGEPRSREGGQAGLHGGRASATCRARKAASSRSRG